ncbi:hypothetical protein [Halanaerobium hydrogeniformans]|uniref:Uncharacterized protein n=1 Tax=Halanaerobium hydrogeniformans TaxID=656519 RepID=E4RPH9_HALHG|nr:hypothetical protein [Halanaerobium hydrogeniformans]ADQ14002.1 hypothetical protein Halsa_0534 [Halanaerobium hydrogeniformans]
MKILKTNFSFIFIFFIFFLLALTLIYSADIKAEEGNSFYQGEFFVGLAELYYGNNSIKSEIELVDDSDQFAEEVDIGRIAFYLRGKIQGKYLITAWLDTGEEKIDEIFKNITDKKKTTPFEKIDAEKYYPVYGDDSKIYSEVDTAGKFYLALESETFKALWGNYRVNYDQNSLINLRKTIYGLNLSYDKRFFADAFLQQPFTIRAQDELELTGGSLYYLRNDDITAGSESITLELKDAVTGRVIETKNLAAGRDYEINYLQGRLILKNRRELIADRNLIEDASGEDKYYIIVNYEVDYDSAADSYDNYGLEAGLKLSEDLSISLQQAEEVNINDDDYKIRGVNLEYSPSSTRNILIEWAKSNELAAGRYFSDDGGLNYRELNLTSQAEAEAFNFEFKEQLTEKIYLDGYYSDKEAGFNSSSSFLEEDRTDYGLKTIYSGVKYENSLSYDKSSRGYRDTEMITLASKMDYSQKTDIRVELKNKYEQEESKESENTLTGALGLDYILSENRSIYAKQQLTLSGDNDDYNITTLGGRADFDKWSFNAQAEAGDKQSLSLGTAYRINEKSELYTELKRDITEEKDTAVFGSSSSLNDKTDIYGEYRIEAQNQGRENTNIIGIDYSPLEGLLLSLDYSRSDVIRDDRDDFKRDIIGFGTSYRRNNLNSSARLEYREDGGSEDLEQFFYKSDLSWNYSPALTLVSGIEYSREKSEEEDEYLDASLGFAYRPVKNDRLNLLGKYTYLKKDNYLTDDDFGSFPAERSQIFALDFIFEISPKWQLTEKIAYKNGEVKLNSLSDEWTSSETYLWVNRLNYQLREDIELFGEYRILENKLAQDRKSGFLLGGYKRFENDLKLGIGYNFTDFNDDLSDLSYESEGWFVNIIKAW